MQSSSKVELPVAGIPPIPQEPVSSSVHYKAIPITITKDTLIVLKQPFACIVDAKAYIDRNLYQ